MTKKIFSLFLAFVACFAMASVARAEAITIDTDTTWTGEVIVDNDQGIVVSDGATLTIAPETIVKMGNNNNILIVNGHLVLAGEAGKEAVITANTASSVPGDWGYISVSSPSSTIKMDYAVLEYGGGGSLSIPAYILVQEATKISINNSNILNNNGSILVYKVVEFSIHNSNIYNPEYCQDMGGVVFCGSSILNLSDTEIDATSNYWGSNQGPTIDPMTAINGTVIQGSILYIPFLTTQFEPEIIEIPEEPNNCGCKKHWWLHKCNHKHNNYKEMKGPHGLIKQGKVTPPCDYSKKFNIRKAKKEEKQFVKKVEKKEVTSKTIKVNCPKKK